MDTPTNIIATSLIASPIVILFYIIYDELRRARFKREKKNVKRLPRFDGWIGIFTLVFAVDCSVALCVLMPGVELPHILGMVTFVLVAASLVYRYEVKYLSSNPDATITHRSFLGKTKTTSVTSINEYKYTSRTESLNSDIPDSPDNLWLWDNDGNNIASFSPQAFKEYSIGAHLCFRCINGRWADTADPNDMQAINKAIEHYPVITRYLSENPSMKGLARDTTNPTIN